MIISGKVQGVFFRANSRKKAEELGLKGYAKNIDNGSVEVVVQGKDDKIKLLVEFLKASPGYSNVDSIKIKNKEFENLKDFRVL